LKKYNMIINTMRKGGKMANNYYGYQYDTNPRKLDYNNTKRPVNKTKKKQAVKKTQVSKAKVKDDIQKKKELKAQKKAEHRIKISIGLKTVLILLAFFLVLFREAQANELFSKIQDLKTEITDTQKVNDQIEIGIQNSINQNNIEQVAKMRLGMQKLTKKQTVYINLPKKDYVEHRTEEVIIEEEKNWFESFVDKIKSLIIKE